MISSVAYIVCSALLYASHGIVCEKTFYFEYVINIFNFIILLIDEIYVT